MLELQANTEVKVRIGPFVDVGDGYTPQTDIDVATADEAELLKHNGAATVDISGSTWAAIADCDGWYDLTLSGTDTNTEGLLTVVVQDDSDCLPVYCNFMVLAQAAWLSKYTAKDSGLMGVDVVNLGGAAQSATDLKDFADTGYTPGTHSVYLVDTCTTNTDMVGTDNAALASVLGAAVGASISADIAAVKSDTGAILTDTGTTLNDKIDVIDGNVDSILTDTGTTIPATITTLTTNVGTVDTVVDGIQTDLSNGTDGLGALKALIDTVDTVADGIQTDLSNGTDGLGALKSLIDTVDTNVDSVLTDTGTTLNDALAVVDANVDAILVDTGTTLNDALAVVDANVDAILVDTGTTVPAQIAALNNISTAEVNAEVLDCLVTDTHAELAAVPAATSSLKDKINWLFALARNKITQTATTLTLRNDADDADIAAATVSDDATTATREEFS
jgi:hypothetical protein